jgi:hypothetical protein
MRKVSVGTEAAVSLRSGAAVLLEEQPEANRSRHKERDEETTNNAVSSPWNRSGIVGNLMSCIQSAMLISLFGRGSV